MNFKHSAFFYTTIYMLVAFGLYCVQKFYGTNTFPVVYGLPILYSLSMMLNYFLHQSVLLRPAMMVNAVMLSSMGRMLGFGGAIAFTVYVYRDLLALTVSIYSFLYLVSLGADIYFVKRFKI